MRTIISTHLICEISVLHLQRTMIMLELFWVLLTVAQEESLYLEAMIKHYEFGMSEVLVHAKCRSEISLS